MSERRKKEHNKKKRVRKHKLAICLVPALCITCRRVALTFESITVKTTTVLMSIQNSETAGVLTGRLSSYSATTGLFQLGNICLCLQRGNAKGPRWDTKHLRGDKFVFHFDTFPSRSGLGMCRWSLSGTETWLMWGHSRLLLLQRAAVSCWHGNEERRRVDETWVTNQRKLIKATSRAC